jgi:hypothetical protein
MNMVPCNQRNNRPTHLELAANVRVDEQQLMTTVLFYANKSVKEASMSNNWHGTMVLVYVML